MNRRSFLRLTGGGLIATATMAEAGLFAEFMDWLRRKPVWSIPANPFYSKEFSTLATIYYNRAALDALKRNLVFATFSALRPLPIMSSDGKVITLGAA